MRSGRIRSMTAFRPTIGLEIHAELATETKMFCSSANRPDEREPNVHVCPVCLAHPGTLPTINKKAVEHVLRVGTALQSTLADYTEFDRKSYFYPDIPKGYQISQYEYPLVSGGELNGVAITRVHLEEDTARSSHNGGVSLVDFNRAGVPLMELVTEPVIHDAETAGAFARELQLLLRTLGASHANLEKGEMRIEANISVSKDDTLGTKVEVKNLNSFRSVERAIAYEIERQSRLIEKGEKIVQETRGWDETKQETFRQRTKEGSADYRYFPEPDLPKIVLSLSDAPSEFNQENIRSTMPELPAARRARYRALGVKPEDIAYLASVFERSVFFDKVLDALAGSKDDILLAVNYITSDLAGIFAKEGVERFDALDAAGFSALIGMIREDKLSSRGAKDLLAIWVSEGGEPAQIAEQRGLLQISDASALKLVVQGVLDANPGPVGEYKAGKEAALQFLLGQAIKATKGAGNPGTLREMLAEALR